MIKKKRGNRRCSGDWSSDVCSSDLLATLLSATLIGLDGRPIRVEVDVAPGLPGFTIVGLADAALREARERVRGALRNSGFAYPPRRITVNLAPADLPKAGASVDLAIAVGILMGSEQFRAIGGRIALIGELGLGGEIRAVPGLLPMLDAPAWRCGSLAEGVDRLRVRRRASLASPARVALADSSAPADPLGAASPSRTDGRTFSLAAPVPDLAEVRGQAEARRALEVALAGGHGLLVIGPPGGG